MKKIVIFCDCLRAFCENPIFMWKIRFFRVISLIFCVKRLASLGSPRQGFNSLKTTEAMASQGFHWPHCPSKKNCCLALDTINHEQNLAEMTIGQVLFEWYTWPQGRHQGPCLSLKGEVQSRITIILKESIKISLQIGAKMMKIG